MKDASDIIRDWVYGVLYQTVTYGGSYIPIYSFPPKDSAMPYIVIGEQAMISETESTKDKWLTEHEVMVEIWTSFKGNDASYVPVNAIADSVLQLLRQRAVEMTGSGGTSLPGFTGFNCIRVLAASLITDRFLMDTDIIIYKSINIRLLMEEQ